jgi:hypothetical protein
VYTNIKKHVVSCLFGGCGTNAFRITSKQLVTHCKILRMCVYQIPSSDFLLVGGTVHM